MGSKRTTSIVNPEKTIGFPAARNGVEIGYTLGRLKLTQMSEKNIGRKFGDSRRSKGRLAFGASENTDSQRTASLVVERRDDHTNSVLRPWRNLFGKSAEPSDLFGGFWNRDTSRSGHHGDCFVDSLPYQN